MGTELVGLAWLAWFSMKNGTRKLNHLKSRTYSSLLWVGHGEETKFRTLAIELPFHVAIIFD